MAMKLKAYNSVGGRILKNWHIATEDNTHVCALATGNLSPETEHKLAHLFAAAPDLAEALQCDPLKKLLGMVEDSGDPEMWKMAVWFMETRDAALQKAGVTL